MMIAKLRRTQFGRSPVYLDAMIDQLQLSLLELEVSQAAVTSVTESAMRTVSRRKPLPEHPPREIYVHQPDTQCSGCGGTIRRLGEDVSEVLEYVPVRSKVIRHVRSKLACRCWEHIAHVPAPSRPIARGLAGPGLLAHVLISKFVDHLPLYRQSEIYAREGVDLERSTLADWVGQSSQLLRPLVNALKSRVMSGHKVHADDTNIAKCHHRGPIKPDIDRFFCLQEGVTTVAVNTVDSIAKFVTNGLITHYPVPFKFLANEDLLVTYIDPTGASVTLTLGTHYAVNGAGSEQGGSVVTEPVLAGPGQLTVGNLVAFDDPNVGSSQIAISRLLREESTNGPRDRLVWDDAQAISLSGKDWAMGGFRVFGKYLKSRAPVFKSIDFQRRLSILGDLAHGMTSVKSENWYAAFAVANEGDDSPTFKIAPFLFVKSVVGNVCTLGKCGEVSDVNVIDNAIYSWPPNSLAGADVLVVNEVFLSGVPTWSMRIAKATGNTASTLSLDNIGSVGPKCFLLPAPSGWEHYRYCTSFYFDTAEVRNIFDCGGGPVRCRMAGTNVVYAHGNDGAHSTYLDGTIPEPGKRVDFSRFMAPLATGIYLQSSYQLSSSSFPLRAEIRFDIDGGLHTPEVHTFKKDSADMVSTPLTVFLALRGGGNF